MRNLWLYNTYTPPHPPPQPNLYHFSTFMMPTASAFVTIMPLTPHLHSSSLALCHCPHDVDPSYWHHLPTHVHRAHYRATESWPVPWSIFIWFDSLYSKSFLIRTFGVYKIFVYYGYYPFAMCVDAMPDHLSLLGDMHDPIKVTPSFGGNPDPSFHDPWEIGWPDEDTALLK
jgi:hypothetical protein